MEILRKISLALFIFSFSANIQAQNLVNAFQKSYAYEYEQKYDAALKEIQAVASDKSYECTIRIAWLQYLNKQYAESVKNYQKSALLMPAATEALWGIIYPLTILEQWTEIEKTYLKIIVLDPKNSVAHYHLGVIYYYRKDYVKAKKYFDVSLNLYPMDYNSVLMSAWTNYFLGNNVNAKLLFNKALIIKPGDKSAADGLALIK
jgi:tetratricopeptide (TPR) repeat protein